MAEEERKGSLPSQDNTLRGNKKKHTRGKPLRIATGILAAELVAGTIGVEGIHNLVRGKFVNPFASSIQLPSDACTELAPTPHHVSQRQETLAEACRNMQQGEIVLVDFDHLGKTREVTVAREVQQMLKIASDGILTSSVTSIPATPEAIKTLQTSEPTGSPTQQVDEPAVEDTPSAIALEKMPQLRKRYPNASFVSLSPQYVSDDEGSPIAGIAYTPNNVAIATVYPNNMSYTGNELTREIADAATHEILHLFKIGHGGTITFRKDSLNLETNYEAISLSDSLYNEYGDSANPMGIPDPTVSELYLNWIQLDDLRQARLKGENPFSHMTVGKEGLFLTPKDLINKNFALLPLTHPVTLAGFDDLVQFDSLALFAWYYPAQKGEYLRGFPSSYQLTYMLYDSHNTQNTALAQESPSVTVGASYTLDVDGQTVRLVATDKGLTIKPVITQQAAG